MKRIARALNWTDSLLALVVAIAFAFAGGAGAQERQRGGRGYPPEMPGAKVETYKTAGDTDLKLYVYHPVEIGHRGLFQPRQVQSKAPHGSQNHNLRRDFVIAAMRCDEPELNPPAAKASEGKGSPGKASPGRPAIVFFFGGGWTGGSPGQFRPHCEYLASRGMVAIAADYRVASRHGVKAVDCVRDAKSAIRYVRQNAARLGIDPNRIVAAGGSAGGHLAACCGAIDGFDEPDEDAGVSSRPNALLLFNPAVVLAPVEGVQPDNERMASRAARMGVEPERLSPYHHVRAGAPPTAIFHGEADTTVPYATVEAFAAVMGAAGNRCELFGYNSMGHGFFNHGRAGSAMYRETLEEADRFLASLGYLEGEPTVEAEGEAEEEAE